MSRVLYGLILGAALLLPSAQAEDGKYADGIAVYQKWCAPCHAAGTIHPGTNALTVKYAGVKSGVILDWTDLTPDYVHYMVRHGMSVMPFFRKTEISDQQLDALGAYLSRNAGKSAAK